MSISEIIFKHANEYSQSPAILGSGKRCISYDGLRNQLERISKVFNYIGLSSDDKVGIVLQNGPEMAVAFLGVSSCAISAPLNPNYTFDEFDFYFSDLDVSAVVVKKDELSPARSVAEILGIEILEIQLNVKNEIELYSDGKLLEAFDGIPFYSGSNKPALLLHTSGTTSKPKIVPLTHKNLISSASNIQKTLNLTESDKCLNVMPLYHIHGLIGVLLASILAGASVVATEGFQLENLSQWMQEFKPTWYSAVPTIHQQVLSFITQNPEKFSNHSFRFIRSSSASLPPNVMLGLEDKFRVPVLEAYGMTEAAHQMTSNPLPPKKRKPGTVGTPTGQDVAIMGENDNFLDFGEIGEIVIKGPNVTQGYLDNPEANKSAFVNGWFRTGDLGYRDEEGYFFISGRIKEVINRGGEKIFPREVDEAFLSHPKVRQAVTFSVKHPTLGEDVNTAVILKSGVEAEENELREYVFSKIADFKVPSRVIITNDIPKGPTGKLQRIGLAEKFSLGLSMEYLAPRNNIEYKLSEIFSDILNNKSIGVLDNFFYHGGDSLSAIQVVTLIHQTLGIELDSSTVFRYPTIELLAEHIGEMLNLGGETQVNPKEE